MTVAEQQAYEAIVRIADELDLLNKQMNTQNQLLEALANALSRKEKTNG